MIKSRFFPKWSLQKSFFIPLSHVGFCTIMASLGPSWLLATPQTSRERQLDPTFSLPFQVHLLAKLSDSRWEKGRKIKYLQASSLERSGETPRGLPKPAFQAHLWFVSAVGKRTGFSLYPSSGIQEPGFSQAWHFPHSCPILTLLLDNSKLLYYGMVN